MTQKTRKADQDTPEKLGNVISDVNPRDFITVKGESVEVVSVGMVRIKPEEKKGGFYTAIKTKKRRG